MIFSVLLSCSSPKQFVQLTSDDGKIRTVHPDKGALFSIEIDSNKIDSAQYKLFDQKAGSSWSISSMDTIAKTIEFVRTGNDKQKVTLHKDQIRYLKVRFPDPGRPVDELIGILTFSGFLTGSLGVFFGSISLPMPSTPWKEDLDLIGRGVGLVGITFVISYLAQDDNKYKITDFH